MSEFMWGYISGCIMGIIFYIIFKKMEVKQ
jgi:hypothetical protein